MYKKYQQKFGNNEDKPRKADDSITLMNRLSRISTVRELEQDDPRIKQQIKESKMDAYISTYEDYLELYIQFGYVVLFAAVSPLAALLALLNNVLEIRIDAFRVTF